MLRAAVATRGAAADRPRFQPQQIGDQFLGVDLCRAACVALPVGSSAEAIRDGETGLLASGTDEWVNALLSLVRDSSLRAHLQQAARQEVLEAHAASADGAQWQALYAPLEAKTFES